MTKILGWGILKSSWQKGYFITQRKHYTIDGRNALCGQGRLIFLQVAGMPSNKYCSKCEKTAGKL